MSAEANRSGEVRGTQENHEKQFTGWWIPAYVVKLFEQQVINAKELIMLATIDSLARGEKGCFASNAYLGNQVLVGADRAKQMISHLRELKLIRQFGFNGRTRSLETYWSRDPVKYPADRVEVTRHPGKKLPGSGVKSYPYIKQGSKQGIKQGEGATGNGCPPTREGLFVSGHRKERRTAPHLTNFDKTAGGHLKNILSDNESDLARAKVESFAEAIYKLRTSRKVDQDRIRGIIRWLKHHYADPYTPKLRKCDDFYTKFRSLEEAKERQEHDEERGAEDQEEKLSDKQQLRERVGQWLWEEGLVDDCNQWTTQEKMDALLVSHGLAAGCVSCNDVGY